MNNLLSALAFGLFMGTGACGAIWGLRVLLNYPLATFIAAVVFFTGYGFLEISRGNGEGE